MASITTVPQEVLLGIISYLNHDLVDLRNFSLTCRALWKVATAALYRDVNLSFKDDYSPYKIRARQLILLRALASNSVLATHVRSFVNDNDDNDGKSDVVSHPDTDTSLIIAAAKNMTQLTKAIFVANPLAVHILSNIQSYAMQDIVVHDLDPRIVIWKCAPTTLRKLTWKFEVGRESDTWSVVQFLINAVEATCPELEFLTINTGSVYRRYQIPPVPNSALIEQYKDIGTSPKVRLTKLRHFGYHHVYSTAPDAVPGMRDGFLTFVTKYHHQLTSVNIPVFPLTGSNSPPDYVLQICNLLPNLKDLEIIVLEDAWVEIDSLQFLTTILTNPAVRNLERFSTPDTNLPFSAELGRLFTALPNLKILQLGDKDNEFGPFSDDGRIQFDDYAPHILQFIKALPRSLTELCLEINGRDIRCDEDEDFNAIPVLGPEIFKSLPRLHTCDIHAWISEPEGGIGPVPEKAVFFRRLPRSASAGRGEDARVKEVWTSRMDCIFQSEEIDVRKSCEEVEEPEEGFWQGKDAQEVWCDGFEFQEVRAKYVNGRLEKPPVVGWPFFKDVVGEYKMFRKH